MLKIEDITSVKASDKLKVRGIIGEVTDISFVVYFEKATKLSLKGNIVEFPYLLIYCTSEYRDKSIKQYEKVELLLACDLFCISDGELVLDQYEFLKYGVVINSL